MLDLVESESRRCGEIVKNWMTFARPTFMNRERADLNKIIDRCVRVVRHQLKLKTIELHRELTADLPHVRCDSGQIEQIILALVMNARISPGAIAVLDHYEWTGYIREPENAIERAMVADREPELGEEDFALRLPVHATSPRTLEDIDARTSWPFWKTATATRCWRPKRLTLIASLHNKPKKYGWKWSTAEAS
jgi:hypothetical protein